MTGSDQPPEPDPEPTGGADSGEFAAADGETLGDDTGIEPMRARDNDSTEKSPTLRERFSRWLTPDPELDEDNRFEFTREELTARLTTTDQEKAAEILAEAKEISERMVEGRTDGVERRAATLQSATAIAGTFSIAGAGLLATDVHGRVWQAVIGGLLLWITLNLGLCGWRATQASASVIHRWASPRSQAILGRSGMSLADARIDRSVDILRAAGWNARYARFKVTMLKRAGKHLVRAALGIPVLVAAILAYSLTYSAPSSVRQHALQKAVSRSAAYQPRKALPFISTASPTRYRESSSAQPVVQVR